MPKSQVLATIVIDAVLTVFVLSMIALCIHGCGSGLLTKIDPFTYDSSCTIYEDLGIDLKTTSAVIPTVIKNPCAAQNIIATTAKTGVVLNAYQADEFLKWAQATRDFIKVGMPFRDVQECVGAKIPELNDRLGLELVTMSDILEAIPGESTVTEDDLKIIAASLDDLIQQINTMKTQSTNETRRYIITQRFRS